MGDFKMVDFNLIYRHNKAYQGDIKSICEMYNYFDLGDENVLAVEYLCLLVDNQPEICEFQFKETTRSEMSYDSMLGYIGKIYLDNGYLSLAYRWLQKCLDYIDYKNSHREPEIWIDYRKTFGAYQILKDADELDKIHNRFLLKWEQDLFYKKPKTPLFLVPANSTIVL